MYSGFTLLLCSMTRLIHHCFLPGLFYCAFRSDALRQFKDAPSVQIKVNSSISPFIIEAEGRGDLAMVCPVRLTDKLMAA